MIPCNMTHEEKECKYILKFCVEEATDGAVAAAPIARIILRLAIQYSPAGTPHCLEESIAATCKFDGPSFLLRVIQCDM